MSRTYASLEEVLAGLELKVIDHVDQDDRDRALIRHVSVEVWVARRHGWVVDSPLIGVNSVDWAIERE